MRTARQVQVNSGLAEHEGEGDLGEVINNTLAMLRGQ